MKKKEMEEVNFNDVDVNEEIPLQEVPRKEASVEAALEEHQVKNKKVVTEESKPLVNCLRNERVIVRHIPKLSGIWGNNPKHVLGGGMAETAVKTFVVPRLSSGMYVNVLTDDEKAYLEQIMGLEYNALSIYKRPICFWDDSNEEGINKVRLTKQDTYLNLADPEDYIRYKILLANKDYIAPSLQVLEDKPKATYQFVLIVEGEETKAAKTNMSNTMKCYKEFGKVEDDRDTLRVIIEAIDGRPTAANEKLEVLQTKANNLIQSDSKLFLKVITDPLLQTKVLIKKCIEAGLIAKRANFLYLKSDNSPLCEINEEPTLNVAAKYLNAPKHQDLMFMLQAKLKQ